MKDFNYDQFTTDLTMIKECNEYILTIVYNGINIGHRLCVAHMTEKKSIHDFVVNAIENQEREIKMKFYQNPSYPEELMLLLYQ